MPYRNDLDALQDRLAQLEQRLASVRTQRTELEAIAREEPDIVRELDRLRREVAARARPRLPLLGDVRVASPCNARWDAMPGSESVRFCGGCQKHVYNLSAMTGEQAEALLVATEGRLCVRFYQRADGTVLTADCPAGVRRHRLQVFAGVGVAAGLALAAAGVSLAFVRMGAPVPRPSPGVRVPASQVVSAPPVSQVVPPSTEPPVAIQGGIGPEPVSPPRARMGERVATPVPQRHPVEVMGHRSSAR